MLVPLDGSRESLRVLPVARGVASQLNAIATALHVLAEPLSEERARATAGLDIPELSGVPLRVRIGEPVSAIIAEAERPDVELLAMTTVAAGDPERELGSVARQVAIRITRPILGMRPEVGAEPSETPRPLHRLLVPLDLTRTTAAALRPAVSLARRMGAAVDVVHVAAPSTGPSEEPGAMSAPRYVDQRQHEWRSWSSELRERLCAECAGISRGVEVGVYVLLGEPADEITRFSREGAYDAIVMVRRSRLEPGRGQILRTAIMHGPCPLLVVGGPR